MGGAVALPLVVEVAFGEQPLDTGTLTWTDISDYVRRNGIDFSRGWDTEAGEPQAGRLTFTLNNESGDFTPGATGAFGEIRNRLPVRVSAVVGTATGNALTYDDEVGWYDMFGATYEDTEIGNVVLWTGLVESWRISWENGVRSQVAVTAVDRWAAIRRLKFDGEFVERVLIDQSPANLWPLTEKHTQPERVEPTVGSNVLTAKVAQTDTLSVGSASNPQTWLTAPDTEVVTTSFSLVRGPAFTLPGGANLLPTGAASIAFTASAWVKDAKVAVTTPATLPTECVTLQVSGTTAYVSLARTGGAAAEVYKTAATTSGVWHHVAVTMSVNGSGACTMNYYLDGASIGSDTTSWTTSGWTVATTEIEFRTPVAYTGGIAYFATWNSALTAGQILEQYRAGTTMGVAGETAAVRAARLLTLVSPAPSLSTTGTFTSTMSKQDLLDKSLADALFECSTAERGTIYMDTAGWPVLTSRSWRVASAVAFTIPAKALGRDVGWTLDDQQLTNSATVDRMVGDTSAGQVKAKNDTSIATYGEQNKSLQVWLDTDAQLLDRANAEANIDAYPLPRSSDLTVDLLTKAATIPAATLLAADIGQRIAVSGLPAEAPGETEFYIENIADKITTSGWERTFTVSPRADYWTLQDATYGALDSTFVLAF